MLTRACLCLATLFKYHPQWVLVLPRPAPALAPVPLTPSVSLRLGMFRLLKYYFCKEIHWDGKSYISLMRTFPDFFPFKQSCSQPLKINSLLWSRRDPLGIKLRKFEWKIWIICHKVETTKWLKIPRKSCLERGGWIFYFLIRFNIGNTRAMCLECSLYFSQQPPHQFKTLLRVESSSSLLPPNFYWQQKPWSRL